MGEKLQRRVAGYHDIRMDGMTDLVTRAQGASVFDIGCNRGLVAFEFANNGAKIVHGCDNYEEGIDVARHLFCDLRAVESKFEVVDLTKGPPALAPFGAYDIVVMLATYHKIKRAMPEPRLDELMHNIAQRTNRFFAWRGTSEKRDDNEQEIKALDRVFREHQFRRVQTSYISLDLGVACIWGR